MTGGQTPYPGFICSMLPNNWNWFSTLFHQHSQAQRSRPPLCCCLIRTISQCIRADIRAFVQYSRCDIVPAVTLTEQEGCNGECPSIASITHSRRILPSYM
ncbi:hypothetical protein IG631_14092 [Alternaria alternata]|nr:hypothetical protein IG631_14092 [Alternaria alternata]